MAVTQTSLVIVVNDYRNVAAQVRTRTNAKGKSSTRVTIDITSEPLGFLVDATALGKGPAEAIRNIISHQIKNITAMVSPSTKRARERAARNQSAAWVQKRYGGGRTGFTPPSSTSWRLFNDSRRLADGVFARFVRAESDRAATFTVNVPANRFNPATFGSGLEAVIARFFSLVPVLRDPATLFNEATFNKAVAGVVENMVAKGPNYASVMSKLGSIAQKLGGLFEVGAERSSEERAGEGAGAEG